jgi:CRISPR-associated protein Csd1
MLLTRLVEHASNAADAGSGAPPAYYKPQKIRWVLELSPDGSLASRELTPLADPGDPAHKNGVEHVVPSITKTSGIAPRLTVDTPEYLFGWVPEGGKADRVRRAHEAFCEMAASWAAADPAGPAQALHRFLAEGHPGQLSVPDGWGRGDQVIVRVNGDCPVFLHQTESAKRFWASIAASRKESGDKGLCLVCGTTGELLRTIPQQLPARLVPQATQSASLVSVNKAAHGFGLAEQLVHTPICARCGLAVMSALENLLSDQWKSALAGQNTRLAWWVTGAADFDLDPLDDPRPRPEDVARMLGGPARGKDPGSLDGEELAVFCAIAIGGNVSRVVVREWIEMPLARIQDNLASWFADHQIVGAWDAAPRYAGIGQLVRVSGRWLADRKAYASPGASGEDRPAGLYQALLRAALLGKPLPPKLLAHLVHRIRADGRLDTERAALLRLALVRRPGRPRQQPGTPDTEAYMPLLNPHHRQPAYLAGQVFAVLEDIQLSAARAGGDDTPNVTFTDRYFARAVTSPAIALVAGRRDARAWLKKLRRDRPTWAAAAERRLDDLFSQIAAAGGIPHGAVLADQAAFILGYHQQRAALRAGRAAIKTAPISEGVPA